jgi:hypothetical protein
MIAKRIAGKGAGMRLDYTTDVELIWPREVFWDPAGAILTEAMQLDLHDPRNRVFLFVHPMTAMALHHADPAVRKSLAEQDCGSKPWEDTFAVKLRAAYVRRELFKIADALAARQCTRAQALASCDFLFNHARDLTLGVATDKDGFPYVGTQDLKDAIRRCPVATFDVNSFSRSDRSAGASQGAMRSQTLRTVEDLAVFERHFH